MIPASRLLPQPVSIRRIVLWLVVAVVAAAAIPLAGRTHIPLQSALMTNALTEFFATTRQITGLTAVVSLLAAIWLLDKKKAHYLPYLLAGLLAVGGSVQLMKGVFGRVRPEVSMGTTDKGEPEMTDLLKHNPGLPFEPRIGDQWLIGKPNRPWFVSKCDSFPSGHAAAAVLIASFLTVLYPRGRVLWFVLATGCALARVRYGRHFAEDVLLGAALGGVIAAWVFSWRWPGRIGDRLAGRTA